jgi:hypothetical protein
MVRLGNNVSGSVEWLKLSVNLSEDAINRCATHIESRRYRRSRFTTGMHPFRQSRQSFPRVGLTSVAHGATIAK